MEKSQNYVELWGTAGAAPSFSHENHGESFYRFPLRVERLSGQSDLPLILAPSTLLEGIDIAEGTPLRVTGQLRSFNNRSGHGSRLIISTFAQSIEPCDGGHFNRILLSGVLCKQPTLRRTPLGRSICDMILAVNRRYGRADYLPCIAWGKVAAKIAEMQLKELEGKMHRSEDVAAVMDDLVYSIRSMIMALPGRLAMDVTQAANANEASAIIRAECSKILNELAGYKYDPEEYQRRVRDRQGWSETLADEADD